MVIGIVLLWIAIVTLVLARKYFDKGDDKWL